MENQGNSNKHGSNGSDRRKPSKIARLDTNYLESDEETFLNDSFVKKEIDFFDEQNQESNNNQNFYSPSPLDSSNSSLANQNLIPNIDFNELGSANLNGGLVTFESFKTFAVLIQDTFTRFSEEISRQQKEIDDLKRQLNGQSKPDSSKTLIYNDQDLMLINAKDPKKYALCISRIIFTDEELENCLLTNVPDKTLPQTSRVPLPADKMKVFREAIMKRFDLNDSTFGEWWPKIKESINACGRHKKAKKKRQFQENDSVLSGNNININNFTYK